MNTGLAGLFRLDRGRAPGNVVYVFSDFMKPRSVSKVCVV